MLLVFSASRLYSPGNNVRVHLSDQASIHIKNSSLSKESTSMDIITVPESALTTSATRPPTLPNVVWVKFRRVNPRIIRGISRVEITPQLLNWDRDVWVGLIPGTDIRPFNSNDRNVKIQFLPGVANLMSFSELPDTLETLEFSPGIPIIPQFQVGGSGNPFAVEMTVPQQDIVASQPVSSLQTTAPNQVCPELSIYHYIVPMESRQNWTS